MSSTMRGSGARQSAGRDVMSPILGTQRQRNKQSSREPQYPRFPGPQQPVVLSQPGRANLSTFQSLMHMDGCNDPDCMDLEQLRELEKSLNRFTDYDHYERCCDGHHPPHHHHHLVRRGDKVVQECCDEVGTDDACQGEQNQAGSDSCDDCEADCEECVEDHSDCFEQVDVCEEDCDQCEEECEELGHERDDCPQNHPTTRDNCVATCDIPLPLLGPTNDFDLTPIPAIIQAPTPCTNDCSMPILPIAPMLLPGPEVPFDTALDHWQTFVQGHHCAPDPCLTGQLSAYHPPHVDPAFGFSFGCDPTLAVNQYPWQKSQPHCAIPMTPISQTVSSPMMLDEKPALSPVDSTTPSAASHASVPPFTPNAPDRTCQWVMPCGSICGANFTRTEDLKKHVKNSHGTKGVLTCGWHDCSASFATEAALTGHISKKHLSYDEEGPWKCTHPNCSKSFMYKQVRDEHVQSHTGGNRMHCPICHQWLNAEGSNFRRHMASHGPKHEHMKCKFEHIGCKRRFPRVDNLRRHEACCKFGKRAEGVHHHHHRIHHHN